MSPTDVKVFLQRWHEAAGAPEDTQRRLVTQLESREHLRALASSPLLCAILCALNLGRVSELPQSRMELYAAALTMLLDLRDAERGIARMLSTSDKTVLLRDLAWRLTLAGRSQLPTAKVHQHVARKIRSMPNADEEPGAIVTHLLERSGVVREPVPGQVDFVHRTFQEYLAGEEAMQDGQVETLIGHAHQDSWTQTIVLACGHGHRAQVNELLTEVLDRADREPRNARRLRLLAAACLETVRDVAAEVHDRVDAIIRDRLVPPRGMKETRSLATIGHRVLRYLPTNLDELSDATAGATVRSAALVGSPEAMARLAGYARDPRENVQEALFEAWLNFDLERYAEEVLAHAALDEGYARITTLRLIPHLPRLRNLVGIDLFLSSEEELPNLRFAEAVPNLRYLSAAVRGAVDVSPLKATTPRMLYLYGAYRFINLDDLPQVGHTLGLFQRKSWLTLGFLRGRSLTNLALSNPDPDCDLGPIADMAQLRRLGCHGWSHLGAVPSPPGLEEIELVDDPFPIDVRPLKDRSVTLVLRRGDSHEGIDELGPNVKIKWR